MNSVLRGFYFLAIAFFLSATMSLILNSFTLIITGNWMYSLFFFTITGSILNFVYVKKAGDKAFTQLLLGAIVIKLLLSLSGIVVYSFIDKPGFFNFSIQFILHYILFTIFEIRYLLFLIKTYPTKHD